MSTIGDRDHIPYYEPTSNQNEMWRHQQYPHPADWDCIGPPPPVAQQGQRQFINAPQIRQNGDGNATSQGDDMPISPPMGMGYRAQVSREVPWKQPQIAHSVGFQPEAYGHANPYSKENEMRSRIMILENRQQRLEQENEGLFSENKRMKTQYVSALDKLATQLLKALLHQQLVQDQTTFRSCNPVGVYGNNERPSGGILKPSQNLNSLTDSTAAAEIVCQDNTTSAEQTAVEMLTDDQLPKPSGLHILPSKMTMGNGYHPNMHNRNYNYIPSINSPIVRPTISHHHVSQSSSFLNSSRAPFEAMSAIQLSSPRDKRPKTVSFQPESMSVGARPLTNRQIEEEVHDTESDRTNSDSEVSESESSEDERRNNESLTRHIVDNIVENKTYSKPESLISEPIIPSKMSIVSPGSQRWSLQRKDSIHSLISEPVKSENTSPFKRGAKSHSSLHRFRKESKLKHSQIDRNSSSANERSITPLNRPFDPHLSRGTPPSLQAHQGSLRPPGSHSKKKKKTSFMDKMKQKLNFKRPEGGVERVETPTGGWMNTSMSPSKSDTNEPPNAVNMTPGRKSIG